MTRSLYAPLLVAALLGAPAACAPASTGASPAGEAAAPRRDSSRLTAEEIQKVPATSAYEVVQRLRPLWLRQRGRNSVNNPSTLVVYVDGVRYGGVGSLRQLPPSGITSMEYLDASTATSRFGSGHTRGAIAISTR